MTLFFFHVIPVTNKRVSYPFSVTKNNNLFDSLDILHIPVFIYPINSINSPYNISSCQVSRDSDNGNAFGRPQQDVRHSSWHTRPDTHNHWLLHHFPQLLSLAPYLTRVRKAETKMRRVPGPSLVTDKCVTSDVNTCARGDP